MDAPGDCRRLGTNEQARNGTNQPHAGTEFISEPLLAHLPPDCPRGEVRIVDVDVIVLRVLDDVLQ